MKSLRRVFLFAAVIALVGLALGGAASTARASTSAFMTMPGEPFVDFQINWRDRCPTPDAFFLGYANGYYGYFPTIHAASEAGYGTASATTWVEVGAGERMVDRAIVRTYEMMGRLNDMPEDLKGK